MSDQPKKKGGKLFKVLVCLVLLTAVLVGGAYAYGMTIPETQTFKQETDINRWVDGVYDVVADPQNYAAWTSNIKEVKDFKKNPDGTLSWTDVFKASALPFTQSEMPMQMTQADSPHRVRIDIVGQKMFTGFWLFDIKQTNDTDDKQVTHVTLTETVTITNPVGRTFFSFMKHGDPILAQHLADLKKKCEADKKPSA